METGERQEVRTEGEWDRWKRQGGGMEKGKEEEVGIKEFYFFFNDTATTEIYTLSLHDALPICFNSKMVRLKEHQWDIVKSSFSGFNSKMVRLKVNSERVTVNSPPVFQFQNGSIKSGKKTKDNEKQNMFQFRSEEHTSELQSHSFISYAVFCLKKKNNK